MYVIESAGLTDVGKQRKNNEDALLIDDHRRLYVVADGMGGHQAGEVASGIVVETLREGVTRFDDTTKAEAIIDPDESLSKDANRLLAGIYLANRNVYLAAQENKAFQGMGSTVSAVYFTADTLIAANVGDSPIYLVRELTIEQLSVPHTVLAEQAALDPEGVRKLGNEFRHMLTRAIGIEESVKADISEIQCFKDDILVIGSDGLTETVDMEEIHAVVTKESPEKACRTMINMANQRGGRDNITVVVMKVEQAASNSGSPFHFIAKLFK